MLCLLFPPRFWGVPKGNGGGLFGENGLPTRNNRRDIMELSRRDLFKFGGIAARWSGRRRHARGLLSVGRIVEGRSGCRF